MAVMSVTIRYAIKSSIELHYMACYFPTSVEQIYQAIWQGVESKRIYSCR